MTLVNCSVYNLTTTKTVLPWSIHSTILGISVQEFYSTKIISEVKESDNGVLLYFSDSTGMYIKCVENILITATIQWRILL